MTIGHLRSVAVADFERGTSTRDKILRTAGTLFATKGYGSTSTRDIMAAVGVTQPGLYRHFQSKDDILSALLHLAVDEPIRVAEQLERIDESGAAKLGRFLTEAAIHLYHEPLALAAVIHTPELQLPTFAAEADKLVALGRSMQAMIEQGISDGDFRPVDPRTATLLLFETTNIFASPAATESTIDDLVDFAMHALLRRPASFGRILVAAAKIHLSADDT
jgi:AcrR family transcriptional regulator